MGERRIRLRASPFISRRHFAVNRARLRRTGDERPERESQRRCRYPPTFAHLAVLTQDVARGTLALVRPQHVDAAECAQQGVEGALVDVCHRARKSVGLVKIVQQNNTGPHCNG